MAAMVGKMPMPYAAKTIRANIRAGNANRISVKRSLIKSNVPPKYPVETPQSEPPKVPIAMDVNPTNKVIRPPYNSLLNTSLPDLVVPRIY